MKWEASLWERARMCVEEGHPCALAVVIESIGSTPQRVGAKLILLQDGSFIGTVGGGLVEAQTIEIAKICMSERRSCVFIPHTVNECNMGFLRCGGKMSIFIDGCLDGHADTIVALSSAISQRTSGYLMVRMLFDGAELVRHQWSFVPSHSGVSDNPIKQVCGVTKSEARSFESADEHLPSHMTHLDEVALQGDHPGEPTLKRVRGGEWTYIEPIEPTFRLVVVGAGHVGKCVAQFGSLVGLEVAVIDDRQEFANRGSLPFADIIICDGVEKALSELKLDEFTFVVIVTRSHELDEIALERCIKSRAAYIGMMGSKLKVRQVFESLIRKGAATQEEFTKVRAPIGLEIGAITPMELAVSIIAEIIASYRQRL